MNTINRARNILETAMNSVGAKFSDLDFDGVKDLMVEVRDNMESLQTDFSLDILGCEVRIICEDEIDKIMQDCMESDLYTLGCYDGALVANITDLPYEMISACKEAHAYEAIGQGIMATDSLKALQEAVIAADGYGHHFASYDHNEHSAEHFYIFRTN